MSACWHGAPVGQLTINDGLVRLGEGLEATASARPDEKPNHSASGFDAVFAEVRVDSDLGEVRVKRLTGAYAAGRVLNPLLARSQHVGGLVWGIGAQNIVGVAAAIANAVHQAIGRRIRDLPIRLEHFLSSN
jgi:CO/xanthine dehydrogenase Mo-binding subunit